MTIALAIVGSTVVILAAATKIPLAATAFLRACIPLIGAFHDLRDVIRGSHEGKPTTVILRDADDSAEPVVSVDEDAN